MAQKKIYVHYGCGFSVGRDWLNFDSSPTLLVERVPLIGKLIAKAAGNTKPFPQEVRYGNICNGLPVPYGEVSGAYASHVLEHLAYDSCQIALQQTFMMLKPGATFRLIVPDLLARSQKYIDRHLSGDDDAAIKFMESLHVGKKRAAKGFLGRLREIYGGSSHLWMWDEGALSNELRRVGFVDIRRCHYGDAEDPVFAQVEDRDRFFDDSLGIEELAFSASKPI